MRLRILSLKRLRNSVNGNPRWELTTTHGVYKTLEDGSVNYEISQAWEGREVTVQIDGGVVTDIRS